MLVCTAYIPAFLNPEDVSGSFSRYNSGNLVNDLLDVSRVGEAGGAQLGELDAEARVG